MGWCLMPVRHTQPFSCINGQGTKKTTQESSPRHWSVTWKVKICKMSVVISKRVPFIFVCITVLLKVLHFSICCHAIAPKIMGVFRWWYIQLCYKSSWRWTEFKRMLRYCNDSSPCKSAKGNTCLPGSHSRHEAAQVRCTPLLILWYIRF